jgi:hypothetical protein
MKNSFPPLLRGIGMLFVLAATVIAFYIARQHDESRRTAAIPVLAPAKSAGSDSITALVGEVRELRAEVEQEDVVEEVLENTWFEVIGFFGSALVAVSFFAEAYVRRDRNA